MGYNLCIRNRNKRQKQEIEEGHQEGKRRESRKKERNSQRKNDRVVDS